MIETQEDNSINYKLIDSSLGIASFLIAMVFRRKFIRQVKQNRTGYPVDIILPVSARLAIRLEQPVNQKMGTPG